MSVTVDLNGITTVRSGVPSTYVLSLANWTSGATLYKIGRTKNLPNRLTTLLSTFNDGDPRGHQGFPSELVGLCPFDAFGGCDLGDDCPDKQYELRLIAHIEGDIETELHHRFAHLRLGSDLLHNGVRSSEWFFPSYPDEDGFSASIDAWVDSLTTVTPGGRRDRTSPFGASRSAS